MINLDKAIVYQSSVLCLCMSLLPAHWRSKPPTCCCFNNIVILQKQCVAFFQSFTKSLRYAHLMYIHTKTLDSCVPPAYVSCHISGATVMQQVGKCHCSLQRLEEGCHTLYRSLFVWLILTGPIHHCWACWLSLQHQPPQAQQLFHGMNAHTFRSISSGRLPFPIHVSFMPFSLLSCIVSALVPLLVFLYMSLSLQRSFALLSFVPTLPFVYIVQFILLQHIFLLLTLLFEAHCYYLQNYMLCTRWNTLIPEFMFSSSVQFFFLYHITKWSLSTNQLTLNNRKMYNNINNNNYNSNNKNTQP